MEGGVVKYKLKKSGGRKKAVQNSLSVLNANWDPIFLLLEFDYLNNTFFPEKRN